MGHPARANAADHLVEHRWKPGTSPNPAGRPKGSRAKLQELAVALLHADFAEHGEETIRRVRERKPEVYLASVVSLLPKRTEKIESPFVDISDDELAQLEDHLRAIRARTVARLMELQPDAVLSDPPPHPAERTSELPSRPADSAIEDPDAPRPKPARDLNMWEPLEAQRSRKASTETSAESTTMAQPAISSAPPEHRSAPSGSDQLSSAFEQLKSLMPQGK